MAVAVRAEHLGARHPEAAVGPFDGPVAGTRREEAGPAAVGGDRLVAAEKLRAAGRAAIYAEVVVVGVLAGERPFGASLAQGLVPPAAEVLPPFGVGLDHGGGRQG